MTDQSEIHIMQALSGRSVSRGYQRMLDTMEGGRQAFLREELAHKLDDPAWLARFEPPLAAL